MQMLRSSTLEEEEEEEGLQLLREEEEGALQQQSLQRLELRREMAIPAMPEGEVALWLAMGTGLREASLTGMQTTRGRTRRALETIIGRGAQTRRGAEGWCEECVHSQQMSTVCAIPSLSLARSLALSMALN